MTRRRLFSLLLALTLLAGTAAPALCAGQPSVICETGVDNGVVSLYLDDLDGSAVYGVQVELVLSGEFARCVFTPSSRTAYDPGCSVEKIRGDTVVTIYLTDQTAMNRDRTLDLGRLDLGTAGTVDWNILPDTANVILLDEHLRPMSGSMGGNLPVTATAPAGTPHEPGGSSWPGQEAQLPPDSTPDVPAGPVTAPFTDVKAGDWYYEAVSYVYARGIMNGIDDIHFSPDQPTTRGMIVTMLHRLEGSPSALPAAFRDVPVGAYYAGPISWAAANNLVNGVGDGLFDPEKPITREQLAAILYRFAQYKGLNTAARADLSRFFDASQVSVYAVDAMSWAVAAGLVTGSDGNLTPGGNATRAQVATIFQRMCVNLLGMV